MFLIMTLILDVSPSVKVIDRYSFKLDMMRRLCLHTITVEIKFDTPFIIDNNKLKFEVLQSVGIRLRSETNGQKNTYM